MQITGLWRYPVKSLRGIRAEVLDIEPWGAAGDRRWAVVDDDGHRVSARTEPGLLAIAAGLHDDGSISIETPGGPTCVVRAPEEGRRVAVNFSRLSEAIDGGDEAATVISGAIGRPLRLVWQPDPTLRSVSPNNGGRPGEVLSLADAGPLLLTSEASLRQLQSWVGDAPTLSMMRFRPNVVVDGDEPFAEDHWTEVELGETAFRV